MKHIDVRFDADMVDMLQSMVGLEFEKFKCDPLQYSTLVYGLVGIYISGAVYKCQTKRNSFPPPREADQGYPFARVKAMSRLPN